MRRLNSKPGMLMPGFFVRGWWIDTGLAVEPQCPEMNGNYVKDGSYEVHDECVNRISPP